MNEWLGKTVLVTGGTGLLGSHLVRVLSDQGATAISVSRKPMGEEICVAARSGVIKSFQIDLLDRLEVLALCTSIEPPIDVLIHCAALDGNAAFKIRHPAEIVTNNVQLASNVLEAARSSAIPDVVLVSSAEIYSSAAQNPIRESDDFTTIFPFPSNGYVRSKVIIEILGQVYAEQYGLRIYSPRPTNLYGPGDISGTERGRVIPAMLERILSGGVVEIWGDGRQSRSFMYAEDAAKAILLMVQKRLVGPLNMATSETITIEDLATSLFELTSRPKQISFKGRMPIGERDRLLNIESLSEMLDFEPWSLEEGLRETIHWHMRSRVI